MVSKIHWSAMSDTLRFACETDSRKCGHNAKHRSDLTACQYLAKHEQSPDLYCKRCARVAADMVPTDREEPGSVTFTAAEVEHLRGLVRLRAAAQRVVKERDALRTECDDLRRVFSLVHGSLGIQQGEHIGNAIDALKKERDELATRLRQSIARGDFAEMRLATLAAELETERERHRQTAGLEWPLSCVEVVKGGDK